MSGFGYVPESRQVSHLTVTKGIVEKIDQPTVFEIVGNLTLLASIGGSHLKYVLTTTSNPSACILPRAIPGLKFQVYLTAPSRSNPNAISHGENVLRFIAAGGEYSSGTGINTVTTQFQDHMYGSVLNPEVGASPANSIVPILTDTLTLDCGGGGAGVTIDKVIHSCVNFECIESGYWKIVALGAWTTSIG